MATSYLSGKQTGLFNFKSSYPNSLSSPEEEGGCGQQESSLPSPLQGWETVRSRAPVPAPYADPSQSSYFCPSVSIKLLRGHALGTSSCGSKRAQALQKLACRHW